MTKAEPGTSHIPNSWSPDGEILLFESRKAATATLIALTLRDKTATPFGSVQNSRGAIDAAFSPDGRWVVYTSYENNRDDVFVQPFPSTGAKFEIPRLRGPHAPVWSRDGKELFYASGPRQFAVLTIGLPGFTAGNPVSVFMGANNNAPQVQRVYDIMPDGKHILTFLDPGDPSSPETLQINVTLNWFEDLKRRVPTR